MKVHLGNSADFPEGRFVLREVEGKSIGVVQIDGEFRAILNYCPHNGAPVCLGRLSGTMLPSEPLHYEYSEQQIVLRCPWHGWEFDLATGKCQFGVDGSKLKTYEVDTVADAVYVHLP